MNAVPTSLSHEIVNNERRLLKEWLSLCLNTSWITSDLEEVEGVAGLNTPEDVAGPAREVGSLAGGVLLGEQLTVGTLSDTVLLEHVRVEHGAAAGAVAGGLANEAGDEAAVGVELVLSQSIRRADGGVVGAREELGRHAGAGVVVGDVAAAVGAPKPVGATGVVSLVFS